MENNKDIKDSRRDEKYLQPENTTIDLPDVKDIPGQEHIKVPKMKEMIDTTISSADEEGESVFNDNTIEEKEANVSELEKSLLQDTSESMASENDIARKQIMLDNTDEDGEPLNVQVDYSGNDLDVPGAELDDEQEKIGSEDEENNSYSLGQ